MGRSRPGAVAVTTKASIGRLCLITNYEVDGRCAMWADGLRRAGARAPRQGQWS